MSPMTIKEAISMNRLLCLATTAIAVLLTAPAQAAAPGITGPTFNLTAQPAYLNQPDGAQVYSWGYGCSVAPAGFAPTLPNQACPTMQVPGPTLIVHEGDLVTVNLTNNLPAAAGNTSILFPGFNVSAGTVAVPVSAAIATATESAGTVTITTSAPQGFVAGDPITISGVTAQDTATIVSASADPSGNVTITTTAPSGFAVGASVTVALATASSPYSGTFTIATVPTATTFTYSDPAAAAAATDTGGGTATGPSTAYNGSFTIASVTSSTTFTYTDTATGLASASGGTATVAAGSAVGSSGVAGLLTKEAPPGGSVTYTFTASAPGTHPYYSGTQGDLQVEMGLYGAVIVLPATVPANCDAGLAVQNRKAAASHSETDFRLSHAAYDHPGTCYDREYLFQFAEMDPTIHHQALAQVTALSACVAGAAGCSLQIPTEPYHPAYFLINGRSMPDDMDPNYDGVYPHQPYNGNPHMHPGEQVLLRVIGQGRWEHPFHEHANHVRILARDANLILGNSTVTYPGSTVSAPALAGLLMFTTDTFPGQTFDGIFYFTGRGLNWDAYGHHPGSTDPLATLTCTPDANGYNTGFPASDTTFSTTPSSAPASAANYYEWCQDHNKPLEVAPLGDVGAGGPATLPNPNIFTNGAWYGGSPYLGPDATLRADSALGTTGAGCVTNGVSTPNCSNLQPSNVQGNPANERGWAFMWHSHNEREITTNNVFPGGMLMMMLVDSREFVIDESN